MTDGIVHHEVGSVPWYETYRLITGFLTPRPIAFVSSQGADGSFNLAPFSFFNCVSANPLMIAFSPLRRGHSGERKDTLVNIDETKEFVVGIVTESIAERMNKTAAELARGDSEWERAGFTKRPSELVKPPCIAESPVNMECKLDQIISFGEEGGAGNLIIGRVLRIHLDEDVLIGPTVDPDLLATVGRLGGQEYTRSRVGRFALTRPE